MPGCNILNPRNVIFLETFCKHNAILDTYVSEMVDCKRNLITYYISDLFNIVLEIVHTLLRQMNTRCVVRYGEYLVILSEHHIHID